MIESNTEIARLRTENEALREALLIEAKKLADAEAEIARMRDKLKLAREEVERVVKERDEAIAQVGERDRQITIMQDLHLKMADIQKELTEEMSRLGEAAAMFEAQLKETRKEAAEETRALRIQNKTTTRAHTEAAETYQLERECLNGEITSLQQALASTASPRVTKIEEFLRNFYAGTCSVTCDLWSFM